MSQHLLPIMTNRHLVTTSTFAVTSSNGPQTLVLPNLSRDQPRG